MKILHVIASLNPADGGPVEGLKQFCKIYLSQGHEVEVASLDSPEAVSQYGFPVKATGLGPGVGAYGYTRNAVPWLRKNHARFDVVVVNAIWGYNAVAVHRALAGTTTPYAVFTHGMLDPYFKKRFPLKHLKKSLYWHGLLQRVLRDAQAVFFTSEEEMRLARQSFPRYKAREVVVPYGTHGPNCDTTAAAEEFLTSWPHLRKKRLALSLGRIHPKKGTDILIEAFAATLADDPAWHLVIAGPDDAGWRKDLEAQAEKLGIANRITWPGMLKGSLKWGAFTTAEIFVLPSHQENFGIVVAEALSCGVPALISDKVNIWREIANYWAALVSEDTLPGTKQILNRWSTLTAEEIDGVRKRSKKCFNDLFNLEATSKALLRCIEDVAQANPRYEPSGGLVVTR